MRRAGALTIILLLTAPAWATVVDGGFDGEIIDQNTWTAGRDELGKWYGKDWDTSGGYAELAHAGTSHNYGQMLKDRRALVQALAMPEAGSYTWSFDQRLDDYDTEFCYWQAYMVKDGAKIDLSGQRVPFYKQNRRKARVIRGSWGYTPADKDDGQWHRYTHTLSLSECDVKKYDYVAFVLMGSRHPNERNDFDNVYTDIIGPADDLVPGGDNSVPEPTSLALLLAGGGLLLRRRRRGAMQ